MTIINSAPKIASLSSSVITPQMPTKTGKKFKRTDFNILEFLIKNHGEDLIYKIDVPSNTSWPKVLTNSNISFASAMLFLVDSKNNILYIGQTNNIHGYANQTARNNPTMKVATVYAVLHQNASMYVHAVSAYKGTFKPLFNSDRGTRFVFSPVNAVLNVTPTNVSAVDWIKANVNSTYTEFIAKFSQNEMHKLCRLHFVGKYSYKALKAKLLNTK